MSDAGAPTAALAPYMAWAKTRPATTYDLVASNMLACTLDDLPGAYDALQLTAVNDEGYAPLLTSIGALYGAGPERVMTATGTSGVNFLVIAAHTRDGGTVLMEAPGYDPIAGACRLMGATLSHFERRADTGFALDVAAIARALTPDTRLIVVTNTHNPSGRSLSRAELTALDALANDSGVPVLVDEAYLDIARLLQADPDVFPRAAAVGRHLISTSSLTKSYGLNGLRNGWAAGPAGLAERLRRVRDVVDGVGSAPADRLATLAHTRLPQLGARARDHVRGNYAIVEPFLAAHPMLALDTPLASTIIFPRLLGATDATPFAEFAARAHDVAVVPGRFFGAPAHFRVSVAGPRDRLAAGLDRLSQALREWPQP